MKLKGLYQKTDSRIWYYQPPMAKGVRPKPISLGTKDPEKATALYHEVVRQASAAFRRGSLRMEVARYIMEMRQKGKHRPATTEHSERVLGQLIEMVGNLSVDQISAARLEKVKETWEKRGLKVSTIASYFTRIAAFFTWAKGENLIKAHPVDGVHYERDFGTRAEQYCTKEQRDRLVAGAPVGVVELEVLLATGFFQGQWRGDLIRIDVALCLWLGFFAGLRRGEIVEARRDWVDLEAGILHVRRTATFVPKGKKNRMIRMSPRLREFLRFYVDHVAFDLVEGEEADGGGPFLLRPDRPSGKKQKTRGQKAWRYRFDPRAPFAEHVRRHGMPWVSFHTMRHTFGTLHALAGTPLSTIARELGDQLRVVEKAYIGYTKADTHSAAAD